MVDNFLNNMCFFSESEITLRARSEINRYRIYMIFELNGTLFCHSLERAEQQLMGCIVYYAKIWLEVK